MFPCQSKTPLKSWIEEKEIMSSRQTSKIERKGRGVKRQFFHTIFIRTLMQLIINFRKLKYLRQLPAVDPEEQKAKIIKVYDENFTKAEIIFTKKIKRRTLNLLNNV